MLYGITLFDTVISVLYIILILLIARAFRPSKNEVYYNIYFKYVRFKILFGILFALIYIYYFKGGDTFLYFQGGNFFIDQVFSNPANIFNLFSQDFKDIRNLTYTENQYLLHFFKGNDILLNSKIVSFFCLLGFKQYFATTILFTSFTSIGLWKLYTTLCKLFPPLYQLFAVGVLFYPTIAIWGSGILKDPVTIMCVGLIFSSIFNLSNGKKVISSLVLVLVSIYVCVVLKPYILYIFIPCMLLWVQIRLSSKIKNVFVRIFSFVLLGSFFLGGGALFIQRVSSGAGKYALDNVQEVAEGFQSWHTFLSETRDQSGYSLGEVEFTVSGIISKAPEAFIVTYFRPFLFTDVNNFSLAFEAVQTFTLLIITLLILFRVGISKFFKIGIFDKNVGPFFLFVLLFGISVGLTSYNFGALSRYKIPALPFFTASLAIIYYLGYLKPKGLMK